MTDGPATRAGSPRALLALVYAALIGLVAVPIVTVTAARAVRAQIRGTLAPAQDAARAVVDALLAESWAVTRARVAGAPLDGAVGERIARATTDEAEAFVRLERLRPELPPDVARALDDLRGITSRARVAGAMPYAGRAARGDSLLATLDAYERAIRAARALFARVDREVRARRDRIDAIERRGLALMVALALLAGAAAVAVLRLARRARRLGHDAERRRREIERLMESKARLIRGIGHDVKNPLSAVQAYADLLHKGALGPLAPAHAEYLGRIARLTRTAFGIVEELLVLSSVEAGELATTIGPVDPAAVAREAVEDARGLAAAAALTLALDVPAPVAAVDTDRGRVGQIVGNLLSNALKYTPAGGRVTVRVRDAEAGPGGAAGRWVAIDVVDTGPGIAPEAQEKVFEEFVRLAQTDTDAGGAGLGLAISRSIARHLGGDVGVASESGGGATFTLWLPRGTGG